MHNVAAYQSLRFEWQFARIVLAKCVRLANNPFLMFCHDCLTLALFASLRESLMED